jgi:hypothetical protein
MLTVNCHILHFFTLLFTFFVCLCSLISLVNRTQLLCTNSHNCPICFLFFSFARVNMLHSYKLVTDSHLFFLLVSLFATLLRLHLTIRIFKRRVLYQFRSFCQFKDARLENFTCVNEYIVDLYILQIIDCLHMQ